MEQIIIYGSALLLSLVVIIIYLARKWKKSRIVDEKIARAKEEGVYEPVSLHPVVNPGKCIQTGACIAACPEKDILGIRNGKATTINASQCIGHGACFHACPTEAIELYIGTETRGVELPHVSPEFETDVPGIYISGELGGMGLIRNAVEQGKQAVENIAALIDKKHHADYDLLIVGAGPAGISASLAARKHKLKAITLEQNSLGGTVFTFPRSKVVMTSAMDLPLHGKLKLYETSKGELLDLWQNLIRQYDIPIQENEKVEGLVKKNGHFLISTAKGDTYTAKHVLLAIGRRGSPRKLDIPGENLEKVAYRLLEPEMIENKEVMVVGGGDSAVESALLLMDKNQVTISYRSAAFTRLKPKNKDKIANAQASSNLKVIFNSQPVRIEPNQIELKIKDQTESIMVKNDLIYIFAGGELPTAFLKKIGIKITRKHGEAILKHK
ncbi:MAG: NAD(P)-binding domain-containing protein [bacterium]